jgi:methylmalonyl-CoA/ethylmalonyl-CoA epimerase
MMPPLRRLDHVALLVQSTDRALAYFRDHLGLRVTHSEEVAMPRTRLTYLDCGNLFLQLVEPLDERSDLAQSLAAEGEGVHHICFATDDVIDAATALATDSGVEVQSGNGRGRLSAFVPGAASHGVRIECTEFSYIDDVENTAGWLEDAAVGAPETQ